MPTLLSAFGIGKKKDSSNEKKRDSVVSDLTKEKAELVKKLLAERYSKVEKTGRMSDKGSYWKKLDKMDLHKDFDVLKTIGRGGFGVVLLVREKQGKKRVLAIKKLLKTEMMRKKQMVHVRHERDVLVRSSEQLNEWIVSLEYAFQDDEYLYLAMEYMAGGDLMTWLIAKNIFTEDEVRFYIAEIIMAVDAIHQQGLIHRDLKPDNILIGKDGHIKLSDFGLCKPFQKPPPKLPQSFDSQEKKSYSNLEEKHDSLSTIEKNRYFQENFRSKRELAYSTVGSTAYIAPEVLQKKGYAFECDWWSLGIIMYEALYGYTPFFSKDPVAMCHRVLRWKTFLEFPTDAQVSPAAIDVMKHLLCDASDRVGIKISVEELKKHKFFEGIDWDNLRKQKAKFIPKLSGEDDTRYAVLNESYVTPKVFRQQQIPRRIIRRTEENLLCEDFTFKRTDVIPKANGETHRKNKERGYSLKDISWTKPES